MKYTPSATILKSLQPGFRVLCLFFQKTGSIWRRLIYLFSEFYENGDIIPSGKYTYGLTSIDALPEWCLPRIEDFLDLLKREFRDKSTIRTYRYPCIRLCQYLVEQNHSGFESLDADTLQRFCRQDHHETFKGKSTYLGIIRRFIIFLEDTGYIKRGMLSSRWYFDMSLHHPEHTSFHLEVVWRQPVTAYSHTSPWLRLK